MFLCQDHLENPSKITSILWAKLSLDDVTYEKQNSWNSIKEFFMAKWLEWLNVIQRPWVWTLLWTVVFFICRNLFFCPQCQYVEASYWGFSKSSLVESWLCYVEMATVLCYDFGSNHHHSPQVCIVRTPASKSIAMACRQPGQAYYMLYPFNHSCIHGVLAWEGPWLPSANFMSGVLQWKLHLPIYSLLSFVLIDCVHLHAQMLMPRLELLASRQSDSIPCFKWERSISFVNLWSRSFIIGHNCILLLMSSWGSRFRLSSVQFWAFHIYSWNSYLSVEY